MGSSSSKSGLSCRIEQGKPQNIKATLNPDVDPDTMRLEDCVNRKERRAVRKLLEQRNKHK